MATLGFKSLRREMNRSELLRAPYVSSDDSVQVQVLEKGDELVCGIGMSRERNLARDSYSRLQVLAKGDEPVRATESPMGEQ